MKYYLFLVAHCIWASHQVFGSNEYLIDIQEDSVTRVVGHVYDSASREPIGNATVTFEELPYGNSIGIIKTEPGTGFFEFSTFGDEGYRIEVNAPNHQKVIDQIQPLQNSQDGKLTLNYYLVNVPEPGTVVKLENLIFDLGKSDIKSESYEELNRLVSQMMEYPEMVIQLEGHTDFRGGRSQNLKLSQERVDEVKKYLVGKGIESERILTRAFGGSQPVSREASDEAAALNRRVEVRIIKR